MLKAAFAATIWLIIAVPPDVPAADKTDVFVLEVEGMV